MLDLFDITDRKEFLEAAIHAFRYEDYWFDKEKNNWPDFRDFNNNDFQEVSYSDNKFKYSYAWCHGAPGIGVARLRAYDITKDQKYI